MQLAAYGILPEHVICLKYPRAILDNRQRLSPWHTCYPRAYQVNIAYGIETFEYQ